MVWVDRFSPLLKRGERARGPSASVIDRQETQFFGHRFFADQREQFTDLPRERAIGIGQAFEILVRGWAEQGDDALLCGRALGGGHLRVEFLLKTFRPQDLSPLPRAGISGHLVVPSQAATPISSESGLLLPRDGPPSILRGECGGFETTVASKSRPQTRTTEFWSAPCGWIGLHRDPRQRPAPAGRLRQH